MFHATTIVGIRHNGQVAIAGDGQVTMGEKTIMKNKATKIRRIYHDKILVGFAGSVADAFTLCEKFEHKELLLLDGGSHKDPLGSCDPSTVH